MSKRALLVLLALVLVSGVIRWETAGAAALTLVVGSVQGEANRSVQVPIQIKGAPNVGALQFDLVYDARVLQVDKVARGALVANALLDSNTSTPGRVRIGVVTTEGLKGDGILANVGFQVRGSAGASSALTIENARAWDVPDHFEILVNVEAGRVEVAAASPPWLLIAALVVAVVIVLFLLLLVRRRRKSARTPMPAPPPVQYSPEMPAPSLPYPGPVQPSPFQYPAAAPTPPLQYPAQPHAAHLILTRGRAGSERVELAPGGLTIGRDLDNGLVLDDAFVSHRHALINFANGGWFIADLNSRNGTLVNRERIARRALQPGDEIRIGQTVLVFQDGGASAAPAPNDMPL